MGLPFRNPPGPSSTVPQYLVSFAAASVAIGGGEAIPACRKEPFWEVHWPVAVCCRPEALSSPRDLPGAQSGVRSHPWHRRCQLLTGLTLPGWGAVQKEYGNAKPGEQPGCSRGDSGETRKPCWSSHPRCTVTCFLGKCRRCLAALAVSAGSRQLLLPPLRLLIRSQHWPSKLLCKSQWLPLEISRCSFPVKLETIPPCSPFAICWARHLWRGAGLLLAHSWGQEELSYRHRSLAAPRPVGVKYWRVLWRAR